MDYKLHLPYHTKKESNTVNSVIPTVILPGLQLNRHMPRAVVYGPMEYGGLELPEVYTRQDQLQVPNLIKQLQ